MAKVFLDANVIIDVTQGRGTTDLSSILEQHSVYLSPLSVHILFYSNKIRVPSVKANIVISDFDIMDLSKKILDKSLEGPTADLEDNIQLHSAAEADCDVFLTSDRKLLALGYFGKTKISDHL